jgi:hypothetical protein
LYLLSFLDYSKSDRSGTAFSGARGAPTRQDRRPAHSWQDRDRPAQEVPKARPKCFKNQPSPAKPEQAKQKTKARISLDSLVRIEPFQWVALTPKAKKSFSGFFSAAGLRSPGRASSATGRRYHDF